MLRPAGILCALACALLPASSFAANYFVDAVAGNDASNGTAAVPGAAGTGPWRTLGKVNGAVFQPGDAIYFRCGQSWRGNIRVASSATPTSPIKYGRYGPDCTEANKPTITTAEAITGWQLHSGQIYVATTPYRLVQIHVDGKPLRLAQYPNADAAVEPWSRGMLVIDQSFSPPNTNRGFFDADLASIASQDLVGAGIHTRISDFVVDDRVVAAFDPSTNGISVSQNASGSFRAKWGYYLDNKLWMLDAPGEFYFDDSDPSQMKIYIWMPDGTAPGTRVIGSTNAYAIDATGAANVVIEGLRIAKSGTGIAMGNSTNVSVRVVDIEDSYYQGIAANNAVGGKIDNCTIRRSVREGILLGSSRNFSVVNNRVTDSGVIGPLVQSRGAISTFGSDNQIKNNTVSNSGYHGIAFGKRNDVAFNRVENACLALADCGGIYTGNSAANNDASPHNSVVYGNVVSGIRGSRNGRDPGPAYVLTPAIYLDFRTSSVYVAQNTISDSDMGIFIHAASGSTFTDNTVYNFDTYAIWMKEYLFSRISTPNKIQRNQIFGLSASPPIMLMPAETTFSHMATYDLNRYSAMYADNPDAAQIAKVTTYVNGRYTDQVLSAPQWQAAGNDLSTSVFREVNIAPFAFQPVSGLNLIANGSFTNSVADWLAYAPQGSASLEWTSECQTIGCARLSSGSQTASASLVSPAFPVTAGATYLIRFYSRTPSSDFTATVLPRLAGPSSFALLNGWFPTSTSSTWRLHSVLFTAPTDLTQNPGDRGGRVDWQIPAERTLEIDSVRVEEVTYRANDPADDSIFLVNHTSFEGAFSCPFATTDPARCGEYVNFESGTQVTWPVLVSSRKSTILVWTGNPNRRQ